MTPELRTLVIDRSKWACGSTVIDADSNRLVNPDGTMCCLGFLATKLGGFPEEKCVDKAYITDFQDSPDEITPFEKEAVRINDKMDLTDEAREEMLTEVFRTEEGIQLEFVGSYSEVHSMIMFQRGHIRELEEALLAYKTAASPGLRADAQALLTAKDNGELSEQECVRIAPLLASAVLGMARDVSL